MGDKAAAAVYAGKTVNGTKDKQNRATAMAKKMGRQLGGGEKPTRERKGIDTVGSEDVGINLEGETGVPEVGVGVGAGLEIRIEKKRVGSTGKDEGT